MNAPVVNPQGRGIAQWFNDTLASLVSGLGLPESDKSATLYHYVDVLDKARLEAMFRADWVSRKIVRIPAGDATRAWRSWQAEAPQIEAIEDLERALKVQQKTRRAKVLERLYGGAAMILGVQGSGSATQELKLDRLRKDCLQFVHVVSRHEIAPDDPSSLIDDPTSPYFGQPKLWVRNVTGGPRAGERVLIHPSRVIRFCGEDMPDEISSAAEYGWGEPVLQGVLDAVKAAGLVTQGTASLINEVKVDVVRIAQLAHQVSTKESEDLLKRRLSLMNLAKSNNRLTIMDKEDEWDTKQISFGSLPELIQTYLMIASAAADIPATRMLGRSPQGMNATGESDVRNYYDKISDDQRNEITPTLSPLDEILIISATGGRDPNIYYDWNPLWQMTEVEKADVAVKKSQVVAADVASMLVPTDALAKGRQNQLIEDNFYPGLEGALEDSDGEVVDPSLDQQVQVEEEKAQAAHERGLEQQAVGHEQAKEMEKIKAKFKPKPKRAFGRDGAGPTGESGDFVKIGPDQYKLRGGKKIYTLAQVRAYYAQGGWDSAPEQRHYATRDEAQAAAGPGQVVVRMRVRADDAARLLGG